MLNKNVWFENLHKYFGQYLVIDKCLCKQFTKYQNVFIFENKILGRVMSIDGIIQTNELDEFIYHEMIVHVPMITHKKAKNILIIGDGDGGILREVSRYRTVEKITMVEIDSSIITCCKRYLPNHSSGSFNDERLIIVIADGNEFLQNNSESYDIIILGCINPISIEKKLFSQKFYEKCSRILNKGGIFISHKKNFFFQKEKFLKNYNNIKKYFNNVYPYQVYIPTFYGRNTIFIWASKDFSPIFLKKNTLIKKINKYNLNYKYYNINMHMSSFSLPEYLHKRIQLTK